MSEISEIYNRLINIIPSINKQPSIINPESKFVVVTYWWGHGNMNANIARPCMLFYETFINDIKKFVLDYFSLVLTQQTKVKIESEEENFPFMENDSESRKFNSLEL